MAVTRPALRYFGGKFRLAPWIISHFPAHSVYVEAFGGAGSVLLRKPRAFAEVYNDLDQQVVNLFRVLRDPLKGERLCELLAATPFARAEFDLALEPTEDLIERARRYVVLSFMGFGPVPPQRGGTGFRANSSASRTPAATDWANLPLQYRTLTQRLAGVIIEQRDAMDLCRFHDAPDALMYLDPPYVSETRGNAVKQSYRYEMTDKDHETFLEALQGFRGMIVLSGYDHPIYADRLSRWRRVEKSVRTTFGTHKAESLWLNPAAQNALEAGVMPLFEEAS